MTATVRGARLTYQPQLDGLRAVAVLIVFLFHADVPLFVSGGYIGVDVFFVLSGYLITALLLREHALTSAIALRQFYLRRVRRLAPALIVVSIGVAAAYLVIPWAPVRTDTLLGCLATLGQMAAWPRALGLTQLGYMGHAWSLSVEEHFYLVWPAVVVVVLKHRPKRARSVLILLATAGIVYGNLVPVLADWSFDRTYNAPDTRASDILIGCLLALLLHERDEHRILDRLAPVGSVIGVVVLVAWTLTITSRGEIYPDWNLIVVVAAALVILQLVRAPGGALSRSLSSPVLVWIGLRSYGIYLIHHPVIGVLRPAGTAGIVVLGTIATLGLAEFSYRFIETPVRRAGMKALWPPPRLSDLPRALRTRSATR